MKFLYNPLISTGDYINMGNRMISIGNIGNDKNRMNDI